MQSIVIVCVKLENSSYPFHSPLLGIVLGLLSFRRGSANLHGGFLTEFVWGELFENNKKFGTFCGFQPGTATLVVELDFWYTVVSRVRNYFLLLLKCSCKVVFTLRQQ